MHMEDVSELKVRLRAEARSRRRELAPHAPELQALRPMLNGLRPAEHVLTWLPTRFEPDPSELSAMTTQPLAVTRTAGDRLTIHRLEPGMPLERHPLGFLQPPAGTPRLSPGQIGLALVPGLAFDRSGGRLGHGGGHYDRLLVQLRHIPLVGVTHSTLILAHVPMLEHDIRMTHLLTEQGLFECR